MKLATIFRDTNGIPQVNAGIGIRMIGTKRAVVLGGYSVEDHRLVLLNSKKPPDNASAGIIFSASIVNRLQRGGNISNFVFEDTDNESSSWIIRIDTKYRKYGKADSGYWTVLKGNPTIFEEVGGINRYTKAAWRDSLVGINVGDCLRIKFQGVAFFYLVTLDSDGSPQMTREW